MTPPADDAPRHVRNARGEGERLRENLIATTERLLQNGQTHDSLSLRAVAREVGIAATSIYLHFPDKLSLLMAVYERYFAELARWIDQAVAEHADPAAQLRAVAEAYWRFADEHPDAYYVMFTVPGSDTKAHPLPEDRRPGAGIIVAVRDVIVRCADAGLTPRVDPTHAALCLWTSLHGLITMIRARPYVPWPPREALLDTLLATHLSGAPPR